MAAENSSKGGKENLVATLTRKVGPLPTWGWLVLMVAAIAIYLYVRRGKGAANTTNEATDLNLTGDQLSELIARSGGMGWGGGDTYYVTGPINTDPPKTPTPSPGGGRAGGPPVPRRAPRWPERDEDDRVPRRRRTTVTTDKPPTGTQSRRTSGPRMWIPS